MLDQKLYRETFSQLHASDEAKKEVLMKMQENERNNRRHGARLGRIVGLAAALTAALAVTAGAVNLATDGALFQTFSIIWSDGTSMRMKGEDGSELTARLAGAEVEKVDGRLLLRNLGEDIDITEAMERDGYYCYEDEAVKVEVEGGTDRWTVTQTVDNGDLTFSTTHDSDLPSGNEELPEAGEAGVAAGQPRSAVS